LSAEFEEREESEDREVEVVREEEEEEEEAKEDRVEEEDDETVDVTVGASTVSGGRCMDESLEGLTGEPGGDEAGDEVGDSDDDSRGTRAARRGEERGSSSLTQLSLSPLGADMGRRGWEIRWMREKKDGWIRSGGCEQNAFFVRIVSRS